MQNVRRRREELAPKTTDEEDSLKRPSYAQWIESQLPETRPRLMSAIDQPSLSAVTLIVAGAGYGKTTLARTWAAQASVPVGWLDLAVADNDPWVFTRRVVDALRALDASASRYGPTDDVNIAVYRDPSNLALEIASVGGRFCLVLDNCECISNPQVFGLLDTMVASLPDAGALMVISRTALPLRLARLRARGGVREIGAEQLRLTLAEAEDMLEYLTDSRVADEDVWRIWHASRGWAAGIALAGTAIVSVPEDGRLDKWEHRWRAYVDAYVEEEILASLSPDVRNFLLQTADLPYLSKPLCGATLACSLDEIDLAISMQGFAFIEPAGADDERVSVHPLVGGSLRRLAKRRVPGADRYTLQARAVTYLNNSGDIRGAARIAVRSIDAPWFNELVEIVSRRLADRSDFDGMLELLNQLPKDLLASNPSLVYRHILARLGLRHHFGVEEEIGHLESVWCTSSDPAAPGRLKLCRGLVAYCEDRRNQAERQLQDACELLPSDATVELLYALTMLGQLDLDAGQDDQAAAHLERAGEYAARLPLDEQWAWRAIGAERANTYAFRGDLHSAITKYELLIDELPPALLHLEGFLRCRLVSLWIERDELDRAAAELRVAERLRSEHRGAWHHDLVIAKARLLFAMGEREAADRWASVHIKQVRRLPEKTQLVLLLARIWLSRGEMSLVRHWLSDIESTDPSTVHLFGDIPRELIAIDADLADQGYHQAKAGAESLADAAAASLRRSTYIEATMRMAVALHQLGETETSHAAVRDAMERGLAGGFVRSFLVPGFDTMSMFADVWNASDRGRALKRRPNQTDSTAKVPATEWLTSRELEILRRVASGESNREIADSLYISTNTVRNHLVKAFRRLDARSRVEAVARARELELLD